MVVKFICRELLLLWCVSASLNSRHSTLLVRLFTQDHSCLVPLEESRSRSSLSFERAMEQPILTARADASSIRPRLMSRLFRLKRYLISGVMNEGSLEVSVTARSG